MAGRLHPLSALQKYLIKHCQIFHLIKYWSNIYQTLSNIWCNIGQISINHCRIFEKIIWEIFCQTCHWRWQTTHKCSWSPNSTDLYFWYLFVDDQHRNTYMNDKDHLVGQLTSSVCENLKVWPTDLPTNWLIDLPHLKKRKDATKCWEIWFTETDKYMLKNHKGSTNFLRDYFVTLKNNPELTLKPPKHFQYGRKWYIRLKLVLTGTAICSDEMRRWKKNLNISSSILSSVCPIHSI